MYALSAQAEENAELDSALRAMGAPGLSADQLAERAGVILNDAEPLPRNTVQYLVAEPYQAELLGTILYEKTFSILQRGDVSDAKRVVLLSELLIGSENEQHKKTSRLVALVRKTEQLENAVDAVALVGLREKVKGAEETYLLENRITRMLLELSEQNAKNAPGSSLRQLGEIAPEWRNEKAVKICNTAIRAFAARTEQAVVRVDYWPFDAEGVRSLLAEVVRADASIGMELAKIYAYRVLYLLNTDKAKLMGDYFDQTITFRRDPHPLNDQLRYRIVSSARTAPAKAFARGRVEELKSQDNLSLVIQFRLLVKGHYGRLYPIILFTALILAACIILLAFVKPLFGRKVKSARRRWEQKIEETESGYSMPSTTMDEYSRLLSLFGLDDAATEDEIKASYRELVKEYHPDRVQEGDTLSRDERVARFVELRHAYERLTEIRKGRFFH